MPLPGAPAGRALPLLDGCPGRPRVLLGPGGSEHPPLFLRSLSLVTWVLQLSFRPSPTSSYLPCYSGPLENFPTSCVTLGLFSWYFGSFYF